MKNHVSTLLLVLIFFLGVAILLYPTVSDYYNSFHQSRAIASYSEALKSVSEEDYTHEWEDAIEYNKQLRGMSNRFLMDEEQLAVYDSLLNITGSGIMGYIEVPKINVALPIYHGTDEAVLQIAIGHIEGTSLPTGGAGTHTVLSGHRGLPSAKLFTDLDQLDLGDIFTLRVLDEVMTYEVDQILIVLPYELDALSIDPEEDYCTLVTCTPYGINTHRMLVRGHRVDNQEQAKIIRVIAEATQIDAIIVAPIVAMPIILVILVIMMIATGNQGQTSQARRQYRKEMAELRDSIERNSAGNHADKEDS